MENQFLPKGYKQPDTSNYLRLKDGQNTIRILSSAIVGYEYWTNENKPARSKMPFKSTPDIRLEKDGNPSKIKHFWAFVVWNYESEKIQVAEITQSTIQSGIKVLVDNKKWGVPKGLDNGYDITITRSGEGFDTEYVVMPNPHTKLEISEDNKEILQKINLEALYEGINPFEGI